MKTRKFLTWNLKNKLLKMCFMNDRQPNSQEHEDCSGWKRPKNSAVVTFHSIHHHCDDRRSPWWARIAISPTTWFLSSTPVLPCFIFGHETTYTLRVFALCKLYYCIYWSDNLSERKNLHKSESPYSFLFGDIRLCSPQGIKISWITALDMFSNLCLVLLLLLARSLVQ